MERRVMVGLTGDVGAATRQAISKGERCAAGQTAMLGLSLEGKAALAGLQRVLVTAQTDAHGRGRHRCTH